MKTKVDLYGIGPFIEECELREKAKKLGYVLTKDYSKTEKLIRVIREFSKATNNLRIFLLCTFIVSCDWRNAVCIITLFSSLQAINFKTNR